MNNDNLNILRRIYKNPKQSQRKMANKLGFSLGKLNYCIKQLREKGLIKINNKPLITHTIDFVKKFPKMDWFVSTDNREIFKIVKKKGFKFNYIRSKKIIDIFWNFTIKIITR